MPRRFVGSRVFGASSGDRLFIERTGRQLVTVTYQPSESKLKETRKVTGPLKSIQKPSESCWNSVAETALCACTR